MIRPATGDDVDAMAAVWLRSALTAYASIFPPDAPKPTHASLVDALAGNGGFVYEAGADIAGLVQVVDGDWLSHLYVDPDHWGAGIGAALHDVAVASGARNLWVLRANTRARAMYERRGWRLTDRVRPVYEPAGVEDVGYELS